MRIQWTNKFSGEQGYVKAFKEKDGYFINTFDAAEAKEYKTERSAKTIVTKLNKSAEAENNTFEIVE